MDKVKGPQKCETKGATITETDTHIEVEYDSDAKFMKTEPTIKDPSIEVDLGVKAEVKKVRYPKDKFTKSQVRSITKKRLASTEKCPMCERTESSLLEKDITQDAEEQPEPEEDDDEPKEGNLKKWGVK